MGRRVHFCLTPQSQPDRLEKQRALALEKKPWLKSTGPKTESGKKRSSQNRTTLGLHTKDHRTLTRALRETEAILNDLSDKYNVDDDAPALAEETTAFHDDTTMSDND
jgi:hypothetical protein